MSTVKQPHYHPQIRFSEPQELTLKNVKFRIRLFRRDDLAGIRALFEDAHMRGPGSPRVNALEDTKPLTYTSYTLIIGGILLCIKKHLQIGAAISVITMLRYCIAMWRISQLFWDYCYASLDEDLKDIETYYNLKPLPRQRGSDEDNADMGTSGPSAFWVVETIPNDTTTRSELIGTVGLDCQTAADGITTTCLRRMAVARRYRRYGIGKLLVTTLLAHAKSHNLRTVYLDAITHQPGAIRMYEMFGWVERGRKTIYSVFFGTFKVISVQFVLHLAKN